MLLEENINDKNILIFGNASSSVMASHFNKGLTQNAGLHCVNYNRVQSKAYNFIENIYQIWLLAIVDLIIGSREYSAWQVLFIFN